MYPISRLSTIAHAGAHAARRHWVALGAPIAIVLITAYTVAFLTDEPLPAPEAAHAADVEPRLDRVVWR